METDVFSIRDPRGLVELGSTLDRSIRHGILFLFGNITARRTIVEQIFGAGHGTTYYRGLFHRAVLPLPVPDNTLWALITPALNWRYFCGVIRAILKRECF